MSRFDALPDNNEDSENKVDAPLFASEPKLPPPIFELIKDDNVESVPKKKKKKRTEKEPPQESLSKLPEASASPERAPHVLKLVEIPNTKPEEALEQFVGAQELSQTEGFRPARNDTDQVQELEEASASAEELPIESDAISMANERFEATLQRAKLEAEKLTLKAANQNTEPEAATPIEETVSGNGPSDLHKAAEPPPPTPRFDSTGGTGANLPPSLPSSSETMPKPAQTAPETKVEIRHASGILPALVVDLLSRRRDRKIRRTHNKDVKRLRDEISGTENRLKQTRARLESEISPLVGSFNKRETAPLSRQNRKERMDKSMPPLVALEKELEQQREELAEKQREAEHRQSQELQHLIERQETEEAKRQEKIEAQKEIASGIQPDLQIDREATPEKTFDRRHEVLDRRSKRPYFDARSLGTNISENSPVPISQVISERVTDYSNRPTSLGREHQHVTPAAKSEEIYKQSLKTGFYVGVVIIFIGLMAYALF